MTSNRTRRVLKELTDIEADQASRVTASPAADGGDIMHLKGTFLGPPATPYEGGTYIVDISIPSDYPFRPPKMKFDTKIFHPNVSSQTGAICLDTLSTAWSPVLTIKSALLSLQSLLSTPEPKDPQDAYVAKLLMTNPKEFDRVATEWAVQYANAPQRERGASSGGTNEQSLKRQSQRSKDQEERERIAEYAGYNPGMIDGFVEMGFDRARVVEAFRYVGLETNQGQAYELEEAYMGDITARLLGEP